MQLSIRIFDLSNPNSVIPTEIIQHKQNYTRGKCIIVESWKSKLHLKKLNVWSQVTVLTLTAEQQKTGTDTAEDSIASSWALNILCKKCTHCKTAGGKKGACWSASSVIFHVLFWSLKFWLFSKTSGSQWQIPHWGQVYVNKEIWG